MGCTDRGDPSVPAPVRLADELAGVRKLFSDLTIYERFEHAVVLVLTVLIMLVVASATIRLAAAVLRIVLANQIAPGDPQLFQAVFGMIFTVIIALEFKHSLLVVLARQESVVRVRSIVLIALLAVARKFILVDLGHAEPTEVFALATAALALGVVYWLVRDQDRRVAHDRTAAGAGRE